MQILILFNINLKYLGTVDTRHCGEEYKMFAMF